MLAEIQMIVIMKQYRIIISGGGTGGHIFPAVAIARELESRFKNLEILFIGAKNRMEMEKVPNAGYNIKGLWIIFQHTVYLQTQKWQMK